VIKFHESIPDDDDFIFNKWHFTPLANRLRASLLTPEIMRLVRSENQNLQPLATTAT
jgi:hypothetical protein